MKIQKNYLYKVILQEYKKVMEDVVPGNAPPNKQVHVFDFDDTVGVTDNPNGVMVYIDDKPAHKDEASLKAWLNKKGLSNYLLAPKGGTATKEVKSRGGWAAYLSSEGLAKIQAEYPKSKRFVTGVNEPQAGAGEQLIVDFTPSAFVDPKTTQPIDSTINKIKKANSQGSLTAIMTARKGSGSGTDFDGQTIANTNDKDIEQFLASKGAKTNSGIIGVTGGNKGEKILNQFGANKPEEIHFYDDLSNNIQDVEQAAGGKTPAELYLYGPGSFAHNKADPNKPNKAIPGSDDKQQQQNEPTNPVKESEKGKKKMKITKESLKRIINQEVERVLSEGKKMKVTVKGKKKVEEGPFGAYTDDYDYVRDSAPRPLSDYERERQEAERKQLQQWRDEEREAELRRYREMSDYDRSTRSDESMEYKKKIKN